MAGVLKRLNSDFQITMCLINGQRKKRSIPTAIWRAWYHSRDLLSALVITVRAQFCELIRSGKYQGV